jgi:hypothetical protein
MYIEGKGIVANSKIEKIHLANNHITDASLEALQHFSNKPFS